ncbi:MAG TPA: Gfo/Idh/MocA family oxidoreductase [Armatimonadota bacterium]|nr:Gfo/Idh/MocA family oxidoreductase [Armatimonadota bacterium]
MKPLRLAVFGCGFWSQFQIAAWKELPGVELVALYNRTPAKAKSLAIRFNVPSVYSDPEELFANEQLDVVDIITDVDTHSKFVQLAAAHQIPVICQKPMAPNLAVAEEMVRMTNEAGIPFTIHENWRWQHPIRQFKHAMVNSNIGKPFRARVTFTNSFPVFDNQPFLRELEQFILTDIGSHILDTARFLFGDAKTLYCQTRRVNPTIKGEDVATVMMEMGQGTTVTCEMSYASRVEHDRFPETYILAECEQGTVELGADFWVRVTTKEGTLAKRCPPPRYQWADPQYDVVHSSILSCNENILQSLQSGSKAETSGEDNLKTVRLVFAAYDSAKTGNVIRL